MTALTFAATVGSTFISAATSSASPTFALTAGQHVLVHVGFLGADTPASLTDTAGNVYTALARTANVTVVGQWFYRLTATGHASNAVTVTLGAARTYITVRVYVVSGTAPTAVTQYAATTTGSVRTEVHLPEPEISTGSMVLAASQSNTTDSSRTYTIGGVACTEASITTSYAGACHREFPSGGGPVSVALTGTNTASDRVLLALYLNSGVLPSASRTAAQASKLSGYGILGSVPDQASASKLSGYALLGSVPDQATLSKLSGYAVVYETSISNAKFIPYAVIGGYDNGVTNAKSVSYAVLGGHTNAATNAKSVSYAVLGGYDNGVTNAKTVAYAVLGVGDTFQSASKLTAYAVLEYASASTGRQQVFTCT